MSVCPNSSCAAEIPTDAKFCKRCGSPALDERSSKCCWCGQFLDDDSAFCSECGKNPRALPHGIPIASAVEWQGFFTDLGMCRAHSLPSRQIAAAGFPIRPDPNEPFVLTWSTESGQVRLTYLELRDTKDELVWIKRRSVPAAPKILFMTRSKLGVIDNPLVGLGPKMLLSMPLDAIGQIQVSGQRVTLKSSDASLSLGWRAKIGIIFPKWLVALMVVSQDEPVNAKAIVDTEARRRRGQADTEVSFKDALVAFAEEIASCSGGRVLPEWDHDSG